MLLLAAGCGAKEDLPRAAPDAEVPSWLRTRPPPHPDTIVEGETRWLVVKSVHLGLTHPITGNADPVAWKYYGFDLDRRVTTAEDSRHARNTCSRAPGASMKMLQDGVGGIDNNFGQHVMAVAKSVKSDVEDAANLEISSGGYTLLLRLDGVGKGDNALARGALYAAGPHLDAPTFRAEDRWPVWSSTLEDGATLEKPLRTFPGGYVRDGIWVSGEIGGRPDRFWLPVFGSVEMRASIVLMVDLASGKGLLAGAIPAEELVRFATPWAAKWDVCPFGATLDQLMDALTQSVDLVIDGRDFQDPTRPCNAVSVGIGFDVVPVAPPVEVVPPPPPPASCDAGTSG